jgi:NAD(P)-dependent dehydrogenase (short-subunit alcohol dehydrogenase family)
VHPGIAVGGPIARLKKEKNMASVLVTGTSKGIGLETAWAFARKGHKVFATMRNPARDTELSQRAAGERLPISFEP